MEYSSTRKFKLVVLSIVLLLVIFWLGDFVFNKLTFRVVSTNPKTSSVATVSPFFEISFNRNITSKNLQLSASPDTIISYKVEGKVLDIQLNTPLQASKSYTITLSKVFSQDNKQIINKKFVFSPRYMTAAQLPKDQGAALLSRQVQYGQVTNNGLVKLLPFTAGGLEFRVSYTITYSGGNTVLTVYITAPTSLAQQDGLNWIKSVGYDPANYNIKFVTAAVEASAQ